MDLSNLNLDQKRCEEGVWQQYGDGRLLIARTDSARYRDRRVELVNEHREQLRSDDPAIAEEATREITIRLLAECCLLGWENLSYQGRKLEHSPELAYRLLKALPLFAEDVAGMAAKLEPYRVEADEEALRNLLGFSSGSGGGEEKRTGDGSTTSASGESEPGSSPTSNGTGRHSGGSPSGVTH